MYCHKNCFQSILLLDPNQVPKLRTLYRAFKRIALITHPDKAEAAEKENRNDLMQKIITAKEILEKIITMDDTTEQDTQHNCEDYQRAIKSVKELHTNYTRNKNDKENKQNNNEQPPAKRARQNEDTHTRTNTHKNTEETNDENITEQQEQKHNEQPETEQDDSREHSISSDTERELHEENYNDAHSENRRKSTILNTEIEEILAHTIKRRTLLFQVKTKGFSNKLVTNRNIEEALDNKKAMLKYLDKLWQESPRRFNHLIKNYEGITQLYSE